jgi:hypothetical protein
MLCRRSWWLAAELTESHYGLLYINKKTLFLAMREPENPKMVNEISLKSLRGPMTPCRADGQEIFLIFPRKKPGRFLFVCTLQAHAIETL